MATEHEVYRSGWQLLKTHGEKARGEALRRAREFERQGVGGAAAEWNRVASAIAEISKAIPSRQAH